MTHDPSSAAAVSEPDDFERWYFGGSPPESDNWERHAFEEALLGAAPSADQRGDATAVDRKVHRLAFAQRRAEPLAAA